MIIQKYDNELISDVGINWFALQGTIKIVTTEEIILKDKLSEKQATIFYLIYEYRQNNKVRKCQFLCKVISGINDKKFIQTFNEIEKHNHRITIYGHGSTNHFVNSAMEDNVEYRMVNKIIIEKKILSFSDKEKSDDFNSVDYVDNVSNY